MPINYDVKYPELQRWCAELEVEVEQRFTKKEIRSVLTEAFWYAADPNYQVDMLILQMVKNREKDSNES